MNRTSFRNLAILLILITILMSVLAPNGNSIKTDIEGNFIQAQPARGRKALLYFNVKGKRWNLQYRDVQFKDFWPYGTLDEVYCTGPKAIFDPNSESWNKWVEKYKQVGMEHSLGLKPRKSS